MNQVWTRSNNPPDFLRGVVNLHRSLRHFFRTPFRSIRIRFRGKGTLQGGLKKIGAGGQSSGLGALEAGLLAGVDLNGTATISTRFQHPFWNAKIIGWQIFPQSIDRANVLASLKAANETAVRGIFPTNTTTYGDSDTIKG